MFFPNKVVIKQMLKKCKQNYQQQYSQTEESKKYELKETNDALFVVNDYFICIH
jgi:hypothetical protein